MLAFMMVWILFYIEIKYQITLGYWYLFDYFKQKVLELQMFDKRLNFTLIDATFLKLYDQNCISEWSGSFLRDELNSACCPCALSNVSTRSFSSDSMEKGVGCGKSWSLTDKINFLLSLVCFYKIAIDKQKLNLRRNWKTLHFSPLKVTQMTFWNDFWQQYHSSYLLIRAASAKTGNGCVNVNSILL